MSRTRTRASLAAAAALLTGAAVFTAAAPALAHDELISNGVSMDESDGSVDAVTLSFSNSIIEVGTELRVTGPDGDDVTDGAPEVSGPDVVQPLQSDLPPGDYTVAWRVVSSDGHPIEGLFGVDIAEDGHAEVTEKALPSTAEEEAETDAEATETDEGSSSGEDDGAPLGAILGVAGGAVAVAAGSVTAAIVAARRRRSRSETR